MESQGAIFFMVLPPRECLCNVVVMCVTKQCLPTQIEIQAVEGEKDPQERYRGNQTWHT